jgi:hypothetical protein
MIRWTGENVLGGDVTVRVGRDGDALVAEWPGSARLVVRAGAPPRLEAFEGADATVVRKLAAELVPALVWHAEGGLSFHASSAALGDRAVAFVGPPDAGKSTAVAELCARHGLRLLADDALRVDDDARVLPGGAEAWVDAPAARALGLAASDEGRAPHALVPADAPASLVAFVRLTFAPGPPALRELRGTEALRVLVESAVRLVMDDPARQLAEFEQLRALTERVPVLELRRPRAYATMGEASALVAALLTSRS